MPIIHYQSAAVGLISSECDALKTLLLEKNRKYGNSALEPRRIFSKATALEQILVRIDDKLSRIASGNGSLADEDTTQDLLGYLILYRVALKLQGSQPQDGCNPKAP